MKVSCGMTLPVIVARMSASPRGMSKTLSIGRMRYSKVGIDGGYSEEVKVGLLMCRYIYVEGRDCWETGDLSSWPMSELMSSALCEFSLIPEEIHY